MRERGGVLQLGVGRGRRVGGGGRRELQLARRLLALALLRYTTKSPLFSPRVRRGVSIAVTLESKLG